MKTFKDLLFAISLALLIAGVVCVVLSPGQTSNTENRSNLVSGALLPGMGADIPSASTITPTNLIHRVTGIAAIATITTPAGIQGGQLLILIPKGLLTTTIAGGNVGLATTAVVDKQLTLIWDSTDSKWKPSY